MLRPPSGSPTCHCRPGQIDREARFFRGTPQTRKRHTWSCLDATCSQCDTCGAPRIYRAARVFRARRQSSKFVWVWQHAHLITLATNVARHKSTGKHVFFVARLKHATIPACIIVNISEIPSTNMDLKLFKMIKLIKFKVKMYLEVENVFNEKIPRRINPYTGRGYGPGEIFGYNLANSPNPNLDPS